PTATAMGPTPHSNSRGTPRVPSPRPSNTETEETLRFARATSETPSRSKSAIDTDHGPPTLLVPVTTSPRVVRVPLPAPNHRVVVGGIAPAFAVATSSRPSPLRSPSATEEGRSPVR